MNQISEMKAEMIRLQKKLNDPSLTENQKALIAKKISRLKIKIFLENTRG